VTGQRSRHPAERATDREVGVVAAVLVAGSEKAAAHRLGLSHSTVRHHLANARSKVWVDTTAQLVWILAPRLSISRTSPSQQTPDALMKGDAKPIKR
jgi:DNA-binding NarL/FixJ family response regulator